MACVLATESSGSSSHCLSGSGSSGSDSGCVSSHLPEALSEEPSSPCDSSCFTAEHKPSFNSQYISAVSVCSSPTPFKTWLIIPGPPQRAWKMCTSTVSQNTLLVCVCAKLIYVLKQKTFSYQTKLCLNLGFSCCFTVEVHFPIVLLDQCFSACNKPLQWWFVWSGTSLSPLLKNTPVNTDIKKKTLNNDVCYQAVCLISYSCLDLHILCKNVYSDAPLSSGNKLLHKGTVNITVQVRSVR